jgi:hypothetical protein
MAARSARNASTFGFTGGTIDKVIVDIDIEQHHAAAMPRGYNRGLT